MSIETLTGDEFMRLEAPDHRVALTCYDQAIDEGLLNAGRIGITLGERNDHLDTLTSLLQLRKMHKVRLAELEDEDEPLRLTSDDYRHNQLSTLPS